MAERSSLKPTSISAPMLTPQGQLAGKPAMPLSRPFTLVGSRNRAHLHLISSSISRNHCCIIATDNGLYLRDLASRTGAIVNSRKVRRGRHSDRLVQVQIFRSGRARSLPAYAEGGAGCLALQ
jgi:pSer/pThr/pTyr-binding forkhead associated (FHA) protein